MLCKEDVAILLTRNRNFGLMWNPPMLSEDHIAIRMHSLYIRLYILSAHNSEKVQYSKEKLIVQLNMYSLSFLVVHCSSQLEYSSAMQRRPLTQLTMYNLCLSVAHTSGYVEYSNAEQRQLLIQLTMCSLCFSVAHHSNAL